MGADGGLRTYAIYPSRITDPGGAVIGSRAARLDVTAQKEAARALDEQRRLAQLHAMAISALASADPIAWNMHRRRGLWDHFRGAPPVGPADHRMNLDQTLETETRRILFVDDEPNILDGLRRMLFPMRKQWDMVFADSAPQAMEDLALEQFDVIVTDMRMPGTDGAELLDQVSKDFPEMVRLVLSGHWDPAMSLRSARNAHQYLTKPCSADVLKNTLERDFRPSPALDGQVPEAAGFRVDYAAQLTGRL